MKIQGKYKKKKYLGTLEFKSYRRHSCNQDNIRKLNRSLKDILPLTTIPEK